MCVRVCACALSSTLHPEASGAAGVRLSSGGDKGGQEVRPVCRQMFTCVRQVSLSREDLCRARGGCFTPLSPTFSRARLICSEVHF